MQKGIGHSEEMAKRSEAKQELKRELLLKAYSAWFSAVISTCFCYGALQCLLCEGGKTNRVAYKDENM